MPYTVFTKKVQRKGIPEISITSLARINLNSPAAKKMAETGTDFVLLLWDAERHRIGIRPCFKKDDERAYQIRYGVKNSRRGANFSCKTFLDWVGIDYSTLRNLQAIWNDTEGMFEVAVPREIITGVSADRPEMQDEARENVVGLDIRRPIRTVKRRA